MRALCFLFLLAALLAPTALAQSGLTDAAAERTDDGRIVLTWSAAAPVTVYRSADPDADLSAMEQLAEGVTGGRFEAAVPEGLWRPYFALRTEDGAVVRVAERVLPLEGGRNFRDLGGYATADGRHTRWGTAFRSGVLAGLTEADYARLSDLDIAVVCDLRSSEERANEATVWRGGSAPRMVAWGYSDENSDDDGGMAELFSGGVTPEAMRSIMLGLYAEIAYEHADKYALMFRQLAAGDTPLLFHCTAGKDRAGTGAALLLTALGVPRETVVADYALSEQVVDYEAAFASAFEEAEAEGGAMAMLAQMPVEVRAPLLRSDPAYIEATFATLEERHGSVEGFIRDVMGISDETLDALRAQLLE
ncbi:MAG: tyrosine-protein phosphatase [Bacteroidota bacterium]